MHKNSPFWNKKCKKIGEGDTPSPDPAPRRLDTRAYGAQAQRDTPEKNPSYGLVYTFAICQLFIKDNDGWMPSRWSSGRPSILWYNKYYNKFRGWVKILFCLKNVPTEFEVTNHMNVFK